MKYSELTFEDKQHELLELIFSFSKNIIGDIDDAIKSNKKRIEDIPYLDMLVEAYFSIQSFCILIKEGYISTAAAIMRIILEQAAITYLIANNDNAKQAFIKIKQEKTKYYSSPDEEKKLLKKQICDNNHISDKQIKQYFDYGWYKDAGCKTMQLESICEAANLSNIYNMVDVLINGFSHGQLSIFQFSRKHDGSDKLFIKDVCLNVFQLFFIVVGTTVASFGETVLYGQNKDTYTLARAVFFDMRARIAESNLLRMIQQGTYQTIKRREYYNLACSIVRFLDKSKNDNEKYFLSQAYVRLAKQVFIISAIQDSNKNCDFSKLNKLSLCEIYEICGVSFIKKYDDKNAMALSELFKLIDSLNDDWSLGTGNIDYYLTYSINSLLEAVK